MEKLLKQVIEQNRLKAVDIWAIAKSSNSQYRVGLEPDQLIPIASVTKPFTAQLLVQLMAEAKRPLNTQITKVDPTLKLPYTFTVEDILCHRSRLLAHPWSWIYLNCDRNRFIHDHVPHLPYEKDASKYHYSNIMYALAGWLCEKLSGKRWETLITEQTPLKHMDKNWHKQCPPAYQRTDKGLVQMPPFSAQKNHPIAPASECMASANTLGIWAEALLQNPPECLWEPQILISNERSSPVLGPLHYGLGWRLETFHGLNHVWHSGTCSGYSALVSLLPQQQRGFVALTNTNNSVDLLTSLAFTHYEKELGLEQNQWLDLLSREETLARTARSVKTKPFPIDGCFINKGYGTITAKHGRLTYNGSDHIKWLDQAIYFQDYDARFEVELKKSSLSIYFSAGEKPVKFTMK